jgi:hypothetical protein
MGVHMFDKVTLLRKFMAAPLDRTDEGFFVDMRSHVIE